MDKLKLSNKAIILLLVVTMLLTSAITVAFVNTSTKLNQAHVTATPSAGSEISITIENQKSVAENG